MAWTILLLAAAVAIHAALEWRVLYADGSYYLLRLLLEEGFPGIEPSRRTAHWLSQAPTVAAVWAGVDSIPLLTVCYGLTCYLLPCLMVAACILQLPPSHKQYCVFPLLHLLAGTASASFVGVSEASLATACFWWLLMLLLFGNSWRSRSLLLLLALPAAYLHEVMLLLAPLLAVASFGRARVTGQSTVRACYLLLSCCFLLATAIQLGFVLSPRDSANRASFFREFLEFRWLLVVPLRINVPALTGLLALLLVLADRICRQQSARHWIWLPRAGMVGFAVVALGLAAATPFAERLVVPSMHFAARNHPALVSVPLALWVLYARWRRQSPWPGEPRRVVLVLCLLAVSVLSWHLVATHRWSQYVGDFRSILAANRGLVDWDTAHDSLPPHRRNNFRNMSWPWTNPSMSFVLSPAGNITAVINNPEPQAAAPALEHADPLAPPHGRFFASDAYRTELERAK